MVKRLKAQWKALEASRPGRRFQDRYERHRRSRSGAKIVWRIVRFALAVAVVALGAVFMFIPGPAILFYFIAGALLATDSLPVAKVLDWLEVRLRALWRWACRWWARRSLPAKIALGGIGFALSAVGTLMAYRVAFR
jgi:hypothetical protein